MFLMNDAVLELGGAEGPPSERLRALSLAHVMRLGAELFSAEPLLPHREPERARRLALLIRSKSPDVNAALFCAPERGCPAEAVTTRVACLSLEVIGSLRARADEGALTPASADREVWRRMAA